MVVRYFVLCAVSVCWRACWSMWRLLLSGVIAVCCFCLVDVVRRCRGWFVLFVAVALRVVCCCLLLVTVAVWCLFGGIVRWCCLSIACCWYSVPFLLMLCWCGCGLPSLLVVVVVDRRCLCFSLLFVVAWCALFAVHLSLFVAVVVVGACDCNRLLLGLGVCCVMLLIVCWSLLLRVDCSLFFVAVGARCDCWLCGGCRCLPSIVVRECCLLLFCFV